MSAIRSKRDNAIRSALLEVAAWIRSRDALMSVYRVFPMSWRSRLSRLLPVPGIEQLGFRRTARWERGARQAAASLHVTQPECFRPGAGVNVYAYVRGQFGLAESARRYTEALLAEGYPVSVHDVALDVAHGMGDRSLEPYLGKGERHRVNLIFVNPDYMHAAIANIGREGFESGYTIACWFWELEKFPQEWVPALAAVDELLVSNRFMAEMVRQATDKAVLYAPLPVAASPDSGLGRADFGLREDAFVFLASFDFNSYFARKNPLAAIAAFRAAFPGGDERVQLLVKSSNGHRNPQKLRELVEAAALDPRIVVRDEILEKCHVQALQRCVDACVSLHRSEGFGLVLAECMLLGKPVVATGWSGNMEFMTPENSCPVDYRMVDVGDEEYVHAAGQRWAEPDMDHAAAHMRRLASDHEYARRIGARAASDVAAQLSPAAVAMKIIRHLDALALR